MDDIDILRQMYAALCGAADDALTLLENGNIWQARDVLQQALYTVEDLYAAAELSIDELSDYRGQTP